MGVFLVTGGAGFIGSNYIHYMFDEYNNDIQIIVLDALTYAGNPSNLSKLKTDSRFRFIKGNICDAELMNQIFSEHNIDYVIHFAAESHVDNSITGPGIFVETNVLGTSTLLNAAERNWRLDGGSGYKHGKKFVHISTDEVYGSLGSDGFFTETSQIDPHSPYSASKAGSDMLVKAYYSTFGLPVNITRCSNNYGPRQFPEKLIPKMITNALAGESLPVYGDGLNVRDWLHVSDHARAIDLVTRLGKPGEVYNIGGHNEKTNIDIVNMIIDSLLELTEHDDSRRPGISKGLISYVEDRKGHDWRYAIDPSKTTAELGWKPLISLEDGLRATVKWYLDNGDWVMDIMNGAYRNTAL